MRVIVDVIIVVFRISILYLVSISSGAVNSTKPVTINGKAELVRIAIVAVSGKICISMNLIKICLENPKILERKPIVENTIVTVKNGVNGFTGVLGNISTMNRVRNINVFHF